MCTIGPNRVQNELLVSYLFKEMNADCFQSATFPGGVAYLRNREYDDCIFLFDCQGSGVIDPWLVFNIGSVAYPNGTYFAFYNVCGDAMLDQLALERGIHGVFYLNDTINMIPRGIRAIISGELWYRRDVLADASLKSSQHSGYNGGSVCGLTYRQREILRLITSGASNRNIAESLDITTNTVKSHIYTIYQKINVKNRLQASIWARHHLGNPFI